MTSHAETQVVTGVEDCYVTEKELPTEKCRAARPA